MKFAVLLFVLWWALISPSTTPKDDNTEASISLYGLMFLRTRISDFLRYHQLHTLTPTTPNYFYLRSVLEVFTELDYYLSKPKMLPDLSEFLDSVEAIETNKDLNYYLEKTQSNVHYWPFLLGEYFFPQRDPSNKDKASKLSDERLMIIVINNFYKYFVSKVTNSEWAPLKSRFKEIVRLGKQQTERTRRRKFILWSISTSLIIWIVTVAFFKLKK
jgi:hypothetical protein